MARRRAVRSASRVCVLVVGRRPDGWRRRHCQVRDRALSLWFVIRYAVGRDVALTSERDSSIGGQVRSGLPAPSAGAWRGIKLEKSSGEFSLSLGDPLIRYAGSDNAAALTIRGFSPNLSFLRVRDSTVGVRLLDGANARLTGFLIKGNAIGVEADGDSAAQILQSTIESNTSGVVNRTPSTVIQATGNWWGHASGPRDPAGNPQGQGDSVSSGVNYGSYLASAPLTNPTLRIAEPRPFFDQSLIALLLSCVNATEYRVAENGAFARGRLRAARRWPRERAAAAVCWRWRQAHLGAVP